MQWGGLGNVRGMLRSPWRSAARRTRPPDPAAEARRGAPARIAIVFMQISEFGEALMKRYYGRDVSCQ